jgi:hypothetical protein
VLSSAAGRLGLQAVVDLTGHFHRPHGLSRSCRALVILQSPTLAERFEQEHYRLVLGVPPFLLGELDERIMRLARERHVDGSHAAPPGLGFPARLR